MLPKYFEEHVYFKELYIESPNNTIIKIKPVSCAENNQSIKNKGYAWTANGIGKLLYISAFKK